jgi:GR25 family glycosyltransferase involved in LPS biosynthesis
MDKLNKCPLVLWINLDRSLKRREDMENTFDKYNLKNIRISAVDGLTHNFDDIEFGNNEFNKKKMYQYACTMSHLKAIKYFFDETDENEVLIMEDDCSFEFINMWPDSICNIIENKPKKCGILQLGFNWGNPKHFIDHKSKYVVWRNFYSTICYNIDRTNAKKLIDKLYPNKYNFSNPTKNFFVADVGLYKSIKTFTYKYPLFTYQDNEISNIGSNKDMHIKAKNNSKLIYSTLIKD